MACAVAACIVGLVEFIENKDCMRVSIITGGGSGIGAAIAGRLAARDEGLMLHGQGADAAGRERLKAVVMDCQRAGAEVATNSMLHAQLWPIWYCLIQTSSNFTRDSCVDHASRIMFRNG